MKLSMARVSCLRGGPRRLQEALRERACLHVAPVGEHIGFHEGQLENLFADVKLQRVEVDGLVAEREDVLGAGLLRIIAHAAFEPLAAAEKAAMRAIRMDSSKGLVR